MTYDRPQPYTCEHPRCDDCSTFDADGFATDGRCWAPDAWGRGMTCEKCGKNF